MAEDGIAYVASGSSLLAFDIQSGSLLQTLNASANNLTGLAIEGTSVFVMDTANVLHAVDIGGAQMVEHGSVTMPQGGGKLFVNNNVAYVAAANTANGGYATADVSDLDHLAVISGSQVPGNQALAKTGIALNGSGIAVLAGTRGFGANEIEVLNSSNPQNTDTFVTAFALPQPGLDVAIGSGLAYVADGTSGLQIVNYLSYDGAGVAPTIVTLSSSVADLDSTMAGVQITEGSAIPLRVSAMDDVQIGRVNLMVNGQVVASDVSAPFDFTVNAPSLSSGISTLNIQVQVLDTGGNATLSNTLSYSLLPDTAAPTLVSHTPDKAGFFTDAITLRFSEAINPALVSLAGATLLNLGADGKVGGGDDTPVTIASVSEPSAKQVTFYLSSPLPFANYQLNVDPTTIADLAGNQLVTPISFTFTSYDADPNSKVWVSDTNGNWNDPNNWLDGKVPGPADHVLIERIGATPVITHSSGNDSVLSLFSLEPIVISGNSSLSVTNGLSTLNASLTFSGGGALTATGASTELKPRRYDELYGRRLICRIRCGNPPDCDRRQ